MNTKTNFKSSWVVDHCPFFYGHVVLVVATLGKIWSSPGQTPIVGTFIDSWIRDLGMSRTEISTYYLIGTCASSITLPIVGRKLDIYGAKKMLPFVVTALSATCFILAAFLNGPKLLLPLIYCLRLFGQGSMILVNQFAINKWFVRLRGRVQGIAGILRGFGIGGIFPITTVMLIESVGWRSTYVILGFSLALFILPLDIIFMKDSPEEYGLKPDGDGFLEGKVLRGDIGDELAVMEKKLPSQQEEEEEEEEENENENENEENDELVNNNETEAEEDEGLGWTRKEALATFSFWSLSHAAMIPALLSTAFMFHLEAIVEEAAFTDASPATVRKVIYITGAIAGGFFNLIAGLFIKRLGAQKILALCCIANTIALMVASNMNTILEAILISIGFGCVNGFTSNAMAVSFANWYGRAHLGAIQSVAMSMGVLSTALGPLPFAIAKDHFGSFKPILFFIALWPAVTTFVIYFTPTPPKLPPSRSGDLTSKDTSYKKNVGEESQITDEAVSPTEDTRLLSSS